MYTRFVISLYNYCMIRSAIKKMRYSSKLDWRSAPGRGDAIFFSLFFIYQIPPLRTMSMAVRRSSESRTLVSP